MKSKFGFLVKYSLKKKINTKWFKVVNVLLCLLLIFIVNMDSIINFFGGDFNEKDKIYVVDNANSFNSFRSYFEKLAEAMDLGEYEILLDNKILDDKDNIDDKVAVVLNKNTIDKNTTKIAIIYTIKDSTKIGIT